MEKKAESSIGFSLGFGEIRNTVVETTVLLGMGY